VAAARTGAAAAAAAGLTAAVLLAATRPGAAVALAAAAAVATTAWRARGSLAAAIAAPVAVVAVGGLALGVAIYPATCLLAALVLGVIVCARASPPLALAAAVLLFEFEGSVKILLGLEETPLPGGSRAAGAAALDLALLAAVAGVLAHDRLRAPRELWARAGRAERAAIVAIGAWLALSVVQIAQGGDFGRGLHGFRLFQWYTLVALAALTVCMRPSLRAAATRGALAIGLVVSLYAALRVAIGPADAERAFALSVPTVTQYGEALRAIGSFSSAVALSSFVAPTAVFALVLGLLVPRLRAAAWATAAVALVGLIGSYSRASLFGVALGLAVALPLVLLAHGMPLRRKLAAAGAVVAILAATYGGLLVASRASPELRERAAGVLDPLGDESVRLRLETWDEALADAAAHPLGQGLGVVGAASSDDRTTDVTTTDNSFLKVLVEQGFAGLALFAAGVLGAVALLARRLRRVGGEPGAAGLAALAGFAAFLGVAFAGETVEQPGKVVAWGLLGMAAAHAYAGAEPGRRAR
jgi:O-antigen ligase